MSNKINRKHIIFFGALIVVGTCTAWLFYPGTSAKKVPTVNISPQKNKLPELAFVDANIKKLDKTINVSDEEPEELFDELTASEKLDTLLGELVEKIASTDKPLLHPGIGISQDEEYFAYRLKILDAITEDPSLVYGLLDVFSQDPNSHLGRQLSAVLSETGLPEVQSAALDVAFDSNTYDHDQRGSALFVIANMDEIDGTTRDRLVESYGVEQDPNILQLSLVALKPSPSTTEEYARVNEALVELSVNSNEHVRRHSAHQITEWATSNEDLAEVRSIALNDTDVNTRARAIMSIAESPIKSAENRAMLESAIYSTNDSALVRKEALNGLNTYELSTEEFYEYQNLSKDLDDLIEIENRE